MIAKTLDRLLSRIFIFIAACFLFFQVFSDNLIVISLATIVIVAFELFYQIISKPRRDNSAFKKKCINTLLLSNDEQNLQVYLHALKKNYDAEISDGKIVFQKDNQNCALFNKFSKTNLCDEDVISIANSTDAEKIFIFCHVADTSAFLVKDIFESKKIVIFEKHKVFAFLKQYESYPDFEKFKKSSKNLFKKSVLSRKNIKMYLISSAVIAFFSIFSQYRNYYLIACCVPLLIVIACLFKDRKNNEEKETL